MLLSRFDHDNLGVVPAFHVLGLSDPLRGYCLRMMQNFVADFIFIQTIDELFWYFHYNSKSNLSLPRKISTLQKLARSHGTPESSALLPATEKSGQRRTGRQARNSFTMVAVILTHIARFGT